MGSGWKIAAALLLLAAIAVVLWGRQQGPENEPAKAGSQPRSVTPDSSTRPARERPGREREERPGSSPK